MAFSFTKKESHESIYNLIKEQTLDTHKQSHSGTRSNNHSLKDTSRQIAKRQNSLDVHIRHKETNKLRTQNWLGSEGHMRRQSHKGIDAELHAQCHTWDFNRVR